MIKIGYQGIEGSNSYFASLNFIKDNNIKDYELVGLINSLNVINALKNKEIDYGLFAVNNSTAGIVLETFNALKDKDNLILKVYECNINIIHSLFKKSDVDLSSLKFIASHPQALKQTKNTRKKLYPNLGELEVSDTALAAKYLENGELDKNCAVLCNINAGSMFNLELLNDNMSDSNDNNTIFYVYKLKQL